MLGVAVWYLNRTRGVGWMFVLFVALVLALNYALTRPEKYGTWGGLNEDERSAERRRRMRRANAA